MRLPVKRVVTATVSVTLTIYIVSRIDLSFLISDFFSIDGYWLAIIFLFLIGNLICVTFRLNRLLVYSGVSLSFKTAFRANVSGLASSLLIINILGSVIGRQLVLQRQGISPALITILTGYERIVLLLVGAGLGTIGAFALYGENFWQSWRQPTPIWQFILAIVITASITLYWARKGEDTKLILNTVTILNFSRMLSILAVTLIAQTFAISIYALAFLALNAHPWTPEMLAGAALVSFAASLPISVNGWGVRELAAVVVFGKLGVSPHDAIAASVLVGICSTVIIVAATPYALFEIGRINSVNGTINSNNFSKSTNINDKNIDRILAFLCGIGSSILLFFQIKLDIANNIITANLADPIALSAVAALSANFLFQRRLLIRLPIFGWLWLGGITIALLTGFMHGVTQFGVTPWALSNRLFGWLIILGYVACGALMTSQFGVRGQIRLLQALTFVSMIVVLCHSFARMLGLSGIIDWLPPYRFEGFSANRNALAFQLNLVLAGFMAWGYTPPISSRRIANTAVIILSFGILQTGSLTGLISWSAVLLLLYIIRPDRRSLLIIAGAGGSLLWVTGYFLFDEVLHVIGAFMDSNWSRAGISASMDPIEAALPKAVPGLEIVPTSFAQRWDTLKTGVLLWMQHPLIGAGLGAGIEFSSKTGADPTVIHSTIVWLFAELGLLGTVAALGIPGYYGAQALFRIASHWKEFGFINRHVLIRTAVPLIIGLIFLLFSMAHDVGYQRILWLLVGATIASANPLDRLALQSRGLHRTQDPGHHERPATETEL